MLKREPIKSKLEIELLGSIPILKVAGQQTPKTKPGGSARSKQEG
jgi:hypothetical protein